MCEIDFEEKTISFIGFLCEEKMFLHAPVGDQEGCCQRQHLLALIGASQGNMKAGSRGATPCRGTGTKCPVQVEGATFAQSVMLCVT